VSPKEENVKAQALTPLILFSFAVALPACQAGEPTSAGAGYETLVAAAASCGTGDPTCNEAIDWPLTQLDLSVTNSQNLVFSTADNALTLAAGSGALVDTDGDGVPDPADDCVGPGWRLPCDGDPSNDGAYQTAYYDSVTGNTLSADIQIQANIRSADLYILMDATGSMGGEQAQLVADLTSGTFVDPTACPGGAGTGLVGAIRCQIPDIWLGVGDFKEVSYLPHNNRYDMAPYHHYLDTTDNIQHVIDAVSSFVADFNLDNPEATTQALYSVVTGNGLGDLVPNRGACPSTPPGRYGYPCFRANVLPIILLFTDADMWNGPAVGSPTYGNPPYDGTLGLGTLLPPVEMSPDVLYSSDPFTAWDLGDLTDKSLTVMGSNTNLGNDAQTWDKGTCMQCGGSGCWTDGRDAFLRFSLSGLTDMFVSGEGTAYHTTNVALLDSTLGFVDCNPGPGGGDYWGRLTQPLGAGDWYAVSDGAVATDQSVANRRGDFQLRFHNLTADPFGQPSWQTADLPITWTTVETELLAANVKFVSIISPNSTGYIGIADATELGIVTGSVDKQGDPYVATIAGDGSGLSTSLLDAVSALVGDTRRDVTIGPEDNLATAIDETRFVSTIEAKKCPINGVKNCTGGAGSTMCLGCLADAKLQFRFRVGNDFVPESATAQVFDFDMVVLVDGTTEIDRFPVRVMVPPTGASFGSGSYENTYDSDFVCEMPPERPDWGDLVWVGSTPSDSTIEFEFMTANTLAELDSVIPVSIVYPTDTTAQTYDIGATLIAGGEPNFMPFLRVRAKVNASSDGSRTPLFEGWTMQFNCIPFD
jgi:hypothetical protein